MASQNFFAGVDLGGTKVNVTLLSEDGTFHISEMLESPSLVGRGPAQAAFAYDPQNAPLADRARRFASPPRAWRGSAA